MTIIDYIKEERAEDRKKKKLEDFRSILIAMFCFWLFFGLVIWI